MALLDSLRTPDDLKRLPIERLDELAAEIRAAIIGQVSRAGGHLAPNLGVVELSIALHRVFDFGHDRLLFDVGHQCYPHKLLTGRLEGLANLRTSKGIAGFPDPAESPYDLFMVGHAGTGISTAVGMARGDLLTGQAYQPDRNPEGRRVVTLIGDASIVNGVAMEGLNNAGTLKRQFLVVLNDNGMSISKPQGAVAQYFDRVRLSHLYTDFKRSARRVLSRVPGGSLIGEAYHKMGEATKAMLAEGEGGWFEHFGLVTVGPIDGHSIPELIEFLSEARDFDRPMVLHVKTVKGKGLDIAEKDATTFHSPAAFKYDPDSCRVEIQKKGRSYTTAVADVMIDLMERDEKVVACTAAMPGGTGMDKVMPKFPERTWDTGICESHAMDMMAGLNKTGFKPFFFVYSTFLQRAFDQAFQEVALQGLAVRLCLDRAGLVGGDGAVHHGFCDVSLLRTLPNAALMAPIDEPSLAAAMEFMRTYDDGLSAVRYPRDNVSERFLNEPCPPFELGKARLLGGTALRAVSGDGADAANDRNGSESRSTPDVAVLAYGTTAIAAMEARDELADEYAIDVYDARFAKPVDEALIRTLCDQHVPIVTVEDHALIGGFGAAVVEAAAKMNLDCSRIVRLGIPDHWIRQDSRKIQLAQAGIDAAGIARGIRRAAEMGSSGSAHASGAPVEVRARPEAASSLNR